MILGQPRSNGSGVPRVPFSPPPGFYKPHLPSSAFYSHFRPFASMPALMAQRWRTPIPGLMNPVPPTYAPPPSPVQLPGPVNAPKMAGAMLGRGPSMLTPYRIMRSGMIPGISSTSAGIRTAITKAPQIVKQATPIPYSGVNVPGGAY